MKFFVTADANYGSLAKIPNLYFDVELKKWLWASSIGSRSKAKRIIGKFLQAYYKMLLGKYNTAVYIVGNAFKNPDYRGPQQIDWLRNRVRLAERFYLVSTNFGPFNDSRWVNDCASVFSDITDICFRDEKSYQYFSNMSNTRFAPDAVFSLGKQTSKKEKSIIISVLDFAIAQRDEKLRANAGVYEKCMAQIANEYLKNGYSVVLLNSNTEQDRPACSRIVGQIRSKENIKVINYQGNLDEIFEIYSRASFVIATRLHTVVLALLYDLPVLPILYDIKVDNLLSTIGFTGKSILIEELESLSYNRTQDIFHSYRFSLSDKVIEDAQEQFRKLDFEFGVKNEK